MLGIKGNFLNLIKNMYRKPTGKITPNGKKLDTFGNSLALQWLGLHASTAGGTGSIPGWGTKILEGGGGEETRCSPAKIRNKASMSPIKTLIQYCIGSI